MPFRPVISADQCCDCTKVTLKDETDYTAEPKSGFTSRTVKLLSGYGDYYQPFGSETINWPVNQTELEIPIDQDYAFALEYTITPSVPVSGSTYSRTFFLALACNLRSANDNMIKLREIDQESINLNSYRTVLQDIQIEYLCCQRNIQSADTVGAQKALDRGIGIYNDYNQNAGN